MYLEKEFPTDNYKKLKNNKIVLWTLLHSEEDMTTIIK